jgi:hypothetical protein
MNESQPTAPLTSALIENAKLLAAHGDPCAIEESLDRADARAAAESLQNAQVDLYWKLKDIPAVVALSRLGTAYLLARADRTPDPEKASKLRHMAKALAYNLASFTWPGWNEPGAILTAADVSAGFEAARLNLRLAEELNRPEKAKANAWWAFGAHQLAAGYYAAASDSFRSGKPHALRANDAPLEWMLDGYRMLAVVLAEPQNTKARQEFDTAIANRKHDPSEDIRAFADQLATALTVFLK